MDVELDLYRDEAAWAALGDCPRSQTLEGALNWAEAVLSLERSDERVARAVPPLAALIVREPWLDDATLLAHLDATSDLLPAEAGRVLGFARMEAALA